jgi:hypothetical protein
MSWSKFLEESKQVRSFSKGMRVLKYNYKTMELKNFTKFVALSNKFGRMGLKMLCGNTIPLGYNQKI